MSTCHLLLFNQSFWYDRRDVKDHKGNLPK